jgi:hypothetical protein
LKSLIVIVLFLGFFGIQNIGFGQEAGSIKELLRKLYRSVDDNFPKTSIVFLLDLKKSRKQLVFVNTVDSSALSIIEKPILEWLSEKHKWKLSGILPLMFLHTPEMDDIFKMTVVEFERMFKEMVAYKKMKFLEPIVFRRIPTIIRRND